MIDRHSRFERGQAANDSNSLAATSPAMVRNHLGERVQFDHPVSEMTTYRVGGSARYFFVAESVADLEAVSALRRETGVAVVVMGRGSNVLIADAGFSGVVVQLGAWAGDIAIPEVPDEGVNGHNEDPVLVRVGGAVPLPVVARQTAAAGLQGFEWAVGVPGTIGGGVRMNAGGHGSDMAESLVDVDIFDLGTGTSRTVVASEVGLRFRGSDLSDADVVLGATLALRHGSRSVALAAIDDVVKWRRTHQPGGQNAGSVFVNPVPHEVSAGELIDRCGLRGYRVGTAQVSEKHANFIQADPGGTASDVVAVMRAVRTAVAERTGYRLRSEVRLIGFPADVVAEFAADGSASHEVPTPAVEPLVRDAETDT